MFGRKVRKKRSQQAREEHAAYAILLLQQKIAIDPTFTRKSYTRRYECSSTKTRPFTRYEVFKCRPPSGTSTKRDPFRPDWHPRYEYVESRPLHWSLQKWGLSIQGHYDGCRARSEDSSWLEDRSPDIREYGVSGPQFRSLRSLQIFCRIESCHCRSIDSRGCTEFGTCEAISNNCFSLPTSLG